MLFPASARYRFVFPQAVIQNSQIHVKKKCDKVSVAVFADVYQALATRSSQREIMQTSLVYILEWMVPSVIK